MIGEPLGFEVTSVVELAGRSFKEGKLRLRKGAVEESVTYHDPCNVARKLSLYEAPRTLLKHVAAEYIEMFPDPRLAICCGGGGNVVQNTEMGVKRLEHARAIHEKILATQAQICATSCQACLTQLKDLQAHYNMPTQMKTVMELVMASVEE
jgi:Fe-S oxidoreductase